MSVRYTRFRGLRVSTEWATILRAAEDAGVSFTLTSGNRTMAEQADQVRRKGVWTPSNRTGAARPDRDAPHIRVGNPAHALDINALDGGHLRLQRWLRQHGIPAVFNVPGEPWHLDPVDAAALRAAARRLGDPSRLLTTREREVVAELQARRRTAKRHGGWHRVDPVHLRRASAAKAWLRARANELVRTGRLDLHHRRERVQHLRDVALDRI